MIPTPFGYRVRLACLAAAFWLLLPGCGTTRMTDTQRTATEQLLISNAIDEAVSQVDVRVLYNQKVYLDPQYLEGTVDRGYLVSSLRQHLLANGCRLQEDRKEASYIVEPRSGGIGTDRHSLLLGVPQMNVPAVMPGQPSHIPEIPFAKKTDQKGAVKIAVFAYNRESGRPVLQSGIVQSVSSAKDLWVLGAGPFRHGTIRQKTEFAGLEIPGLNDGADGALKKKRHLRVTQSAVWPEYLDRPHGDRRVSTKDVEIIQSGHSKAAKPPADPPPPPKLFRTPPVSPNAGGKAETQPNQAVGSGLPPGSNP